MTTSTFAPFKAIKVTCEVEWDLDDDFPWEEGKDNKDRVPSKNYTVELDAQELLDEGLISNSQDGRYAIDEDAIIHSEVLSDALTDDAGFCHNGYKVLEITPVAN